MNSAHKAAFQIRNLLIEKRHQRDSRESNAATGEIIAEFQRENEKLVRQALPVLVPMALRGLFHQGTRRRPKSIDPIQSAFFKELGISDCIYVRSEKSGKLKPQDFFDSTLDEIETHRDRLPDPHDGATKDKITVALEMLRPFQRNSKSTAGECLLARQAALGNGDAKSEETR
jgi:hypothetical protein